MGRKMGNTAYNRALAFESIHDDLKEKFDGATEQFSRVTHEDLERFARTVAYKVAYNLKNGFEMDPDSDPLDYGESKNVEGE
jgi:hypothetical protein